MASIGEVGSTTITSPPEPVTEPDLPVAEAPAVVITEAPTVEVTTKKTPAPRNKALVWVGGALRRLWMARGFFGGLIAMYLAFNAQRNLIEQGTWEVSQRLYLAAFVILILTLMHPTFAFFRRKPKKAKVAATPVVVEATPTPVDTLESTVALEPHLNGSVTINGEHVHLANGNGIEVHDHSNGVAVTGNGNGHTEPETLNDLEVIAPLPTRRAGRRVSLDTAALSSDMPVVTESVALPAVAAPVVAEPVVVEPIVPEPDPVVAPMVPTRPRRVSKVRTSTRPLDEAEVPISVVAASKGKGRFSRYRTAYLNMRASLGWKATLPMFLVTVGLAVWLYFLFQQDIASSLFGWMWFGAMLLMVATFYGAPRWPRALQGLLDGPDEGFFARGVPTIPVKLETALVLIMLVGALAIRLWNLEYLPGIFGDEGERGLDARGILHGNTDPIFGAGWWVVPNLYFYILSWSLRIFGDNLIGDRMLSVICGMLVIFLIYKIGKLLWGARAGLIAGSLLAISPIWIMFSRHASESTPTVTCWVIGFYFMFRALRFRQWVDWALAGMGFGFSLYFYASGKLVVPLLLAIGGYMLVRWRLEFFKRYAAGFGVLLTTFMMTFLPHFVWLKIGNFDGFFLRARETSIFAPGHAAQIFNNFNVAYDQSLANLSVVDNLLRAPGPWALVIWNQFRISFDVLYRVSGGSTFFYQLNDHNGTLLTPTIACLCLLGMAYGLWKLWDARYGIALVWFVVGLAGVAFTMDTPHVQRIVGSWPVLMLFPAVMIDRVLASAWPLNIKFARRWLTIPVIALFVFASYEAIREYFVVYESGCSICASTVQARYVATFGNDYKGYLFGVGGYPVYFDYGSTRFTVPDAEGEDLNIPMDFFPVTSNKGKGMAFMFYPANLQYKSIVSMFYPDGIAQDMKGNNDAFIFASYKVPPAQVAAMQSTFAEYTDVRGETARRNEPNLGTARPKGANPWAAPPQLIYPLTASWTGGLVAPEFGQYTFLLSGGSDAVFTIDGQVLLDGKDPNKLQGTVILARGSHEVHISGTLPDSFSRIELGWAGGSSSPVPISSNYLYNGVLGGLTASFSDNSTLPIDAADPFAGVVPTKYQIHPFLSVRDAGGQTASFQGRAVYIRWQGSILAPVTGSYAFTIQSNGPNAMFIDGQSIINSQGPVASPNPIMLTAGEHTVDIRYAWQGQFGGTFEWYWTPPGGSSTIVPPNVLTPLKRLWQPGEIAAPVTSPNVAPPPPASIAVKADAILGADADLKEAVGLGADAAGNVYIGDNGNSRIVELDSSGRTVRTWGSPTETSAQGKFGMLSDIYATADGHLFTLDTKTGDLHVFNPDGTVARYIPGLARSSLGITVGPNGNIYIGNTIGSAVLVFSPEGNLLDKFEGGAGGTLQHFEQPMDVAVGPNGTVYEIDMRGRAAQLDAAGNIVREWPMQWGITRGGSHLVYWKNKLVVTDSDRHRLIVVDLTTNATSFVGTEGNSDSQMRIPVGIAVGADDKLYVMDSGNNRVLVFNDLDP